MFVNFQNSLSTLLQFLFMKQKDTEEFTAANYLPLAE